MTEHDCTPICWDQVVEKSLEDLSEGQKLAVYKHAYEMVLKVWHPDMPELRPAFLVDARKLIGL